MRSRLGVALTPVTLYGPSITAVRSFGWPPTMCTSWLSRSAGLEDVLPHASAARAT